MGCLYSKSIMLSSGNKNTCCLLCLVYNDLKYLVCSAQWDAGLKSWDFSLNAPASCERLFCHGNLVGVLPQWDLWGGFFFSLNCVSYLSYILTELCLCLFHCLLWLNTKVGFFWFPVLEVFNTKRSKWGHAKHSWSKIKMTYWVHFAQDLNE